MTDKEIIEKVNIVLKKIDAFFHGLEPSLKNAISRDTYFEQHPEITDHKNFNFSLSADDIINQKIPYNAAGCTGRAKLFSKYAQEIGLKDFSIVATAKKEDIKNKNSGKMIDGHQLVAIKLSDGLHMIDPGKGKTYEKAQIDGACKVGENIDAVGHNQKDYVISAILKPSEYDNIKTYEQMESLYLRGAFNVGINKIKEKQIEIIPIKSLSFAQEYRILKNAKNKIQQKINLLLDDTVGNFQQINALITEREQYSNAIIKLLQKETQKHSPQYAKQMFDMSADIVKKHLSDDAVRFDLLSAQQKLKFGQKFIDYIAKRLNIIPNKLVLKDNMPQNKGAEYDFNTGDININKNYMGNMQDFIGMILHEFTHHLYVRHPDRSPLGEQKVAAVMENFIPDSPNGVTSPQELAAYKQRPFESIAYYLQDFFKENKFGEHVLLQIVEQQTVFAKTLKNR